MKGFIKVLVKMVENVINGVEYEKIAAAVVILYKKWGKSPYL